MDLSLHMLTGKQAKYLRLIAIYGFVPSGPEMLKDLDRIVESNGERCVSPINVQTDSNLKNPKVICLDETGFADMYPSLAGMQRATFGMVPALRVKLAGDEISNV